MPDVLFYTPGGGAGHVNRCASIARVLQRDGLDVLIGHSTSHAALLAREGIPAERLWQPREFLTNNTAKVTVVDVYPNGMVGELDGFDWPGKKAYLRRAGVDTETSRVFDAVIDADNGDGILIRDYDELLDADEARAVLRVTGMPVVAVATAWDDEWAEATIEHLKLGEWQVIRTDYYPLLEAFRAINCVVGPAGYNLASECAATGIPSVLVARDRQHHDDQNLRANCDDDPTAIFDAVSARVRTDVALRRYENQAPLVAQRLKELL